MRKRVYFILFGLSLLISSGLFAAPEQERTPASGGAPLNIFNSQVTDLLVPQHGDFKNRFIIGAISGGGGYYRYRNVVFV